MSNVPPQRNLPPSSERWGRRVDSTVEQLEKVLFGESGAILSDNRGSAGSLAVLGRNVDDLATQIDDLEGRRVEFITHPGFDVNVNAVMNQLVTFSGSGSISVPAPVNASSRVMIAVMTMEGYSSNHARGPATVNAVVSGGGLSSSMQFGPFPVPAQANLPPGWVGRETRSTSGVGSGLNINLSYSGNIFGSSTGSVRIGIANISLAIIYGQEA